jgi:DNA-binding MarR family transcriptional regulator
MQTEADGAEPGKSGHIYEIAESWRRERPDLNLDDFLLAIYLLRLGRIIGDMNDRMCSARFGISGADMGLLFALRRAGKPYVRKPRDLYLALLVTSGAIAKQVDRLSKLNLVQRRSDPDHSGGILLQLTQKGLQMTNDAADILARKSPIARGVKSLSARERESGRRFVESVLTALESKSPSGVRRAPRGERVTYPKRRPNP